MTISVFIDSNVWDFLFERKLDLAVALPRPEFSLGITREAEFEIPLVPAAKRAFIETTIAKCGVATDTFFGFAEASLPGDQHRVGGFNVGRFASAEEIAFLAQPRTLPPADKRPTKLYKNEADLSLAARSFHSVVLTLDAKAGPLREARRQGGKVVFLTDFDASGLSLGDYIKRQLGPNAP